MKANDSKGKGLVSRAGQSARRPIILLLAGRRLSSTIHLVKHTVCSVTHSLVFILTSRDVDAVTYNDE